jgi:ubiquinone/menaquinone biosynthesis C-methylase UbiE
VPADWLPDLLRAEPRRRLRDEGRGVLSVLPPEEGHAGRFEGLYGGLYDHAIQSDTIRRLAPLAYGDPGPIGDLDSFVVRVATQTQPAKSGRPPVLLDVPVGGGTLLPRLWRRGFRGRVIASDLGTAMLDRSAQIAERVPLDIALLRADAQDLPLKANTVDAVVSLNGLHVMPDPQAFVDELGRVVRRRGRLFLVTLVSRGNLRSDAILRVGRIAGIIPTPPPTRETLLRWLADAGFASQVPLGGTGLMGIAATRR